MCKNQYNAAVENFSTVWFSYEKNMFRNRKKMSEKRTEYKSHEPLYFKINTLSNKSEDVKVRINNIY